MISTNLLTAVAVRAAVEQMRTELARRYTLLSSMPTLFYDWNKGYSQQFMQYFAEIPEGERNFPWIALVYTYGESIPCRVQPRQLENVGKVLYSDNGTRAAAMLDTRLMSVDILCSILTNDSNYADSLCINRVLDQSKVKRVTYQDAFQYVWQPSTEFPANCTILSPNPNGFMYRCSSAGATGSTEPEWPTELNESVDDNDLEWTCIPADTVTGSISGITLPKLIVSDYYAKGIEYQIDFAFTLNFVGVQDAEFNVQSILGIDNWLFMVLNKLNAFSNK